MNLIKIPDITTFLNKTYKFLSTTDSYKLYNNLTFKIISIINGNVKIKIKSSYEDAKKNVLIDIDRIIRNYKGQLKILNKIIDTWEKDVDKFKIIEDSSWNIPTDYNPKGGHCINTGAKVPKNHPMKYGMAENSNDTIMTFDYYHVDDKLNIYSYQDGTNVWYSKDTYYYIRKSVLNSIKEHVENKNEKVSKDWFKYILHKKEITLSISELNQMDYIIID